jgi:spore germination cell wall hydrolase CwlJ-like protein
MQTFFKKASIFLLVVATLMTAYNVKVSMAGINHDYDIPFNRMTKTAQAQVECLAENIYFEARNEPIEGQYAVAFVTMNRVKSPDFPNDICGVVKQKIKVERIGNKRTVCQFSWWCESTPHYISTNNILTETDNKKYNEILRTATRFYANYERMSDPTNGALFYHADYVSPNWKNLQRVTQIGRHIFYQERKI